MEKRRSLCSLGGITGNFQVAATLDNVYSFQFERVGHPVKTADELWRKKHTDFINITGVDESARDGCSALDEHALKRTTTKLT
jgi:hypothetical protein